MTNSDGAWSVILVPPDSRAEAEVIGSAIEAGRSVFTIDFTAATERESLLGLLGREFLFPYEARDFDVAVDLLSDLDWFGNDDGYVYILRNIDVLEQRNPELSATFVRMLPNLCDRWHSGGTPFDVLVVAGPETRARLYSVVDWWNEMIRTGHWNVPMYEVPIVEYDS